MDAFTALAHPDRRRILELLADRELTAGELAEAFGVSRPAVSWQLRGLLDAGLVTVRAEGRRRWYAAAWAGLEPVTAWLAASRPGWSDRLDALGDKLAERDRGAA